MSLTSFYFFPFLLICLLLYYCIKPAQKYILLAASIFFYITISSNSLLKLALLILSFSLVSYCGGVLIEKTTGAWKRAIFAICVLLLLGTLCVLKYSYHLMQGFSHLFRFSSDFSFLHFGTVIGLSYYTLSAVGYLTDVYWGTCQAERNPFDVALFIFYFPQLISGPITRYSNIRPQFSEIKKPNYDNISLGIRRMAWGYFKKLVISERFALVVSGVYRNYSDYSLIGIVIATLCYAVQLYTDFSGCMDIVIGASNLFGIALPENFSAPFFSETIQEFWQRWHITLGLWFKDYLMYPLQKSGAVQFFGRLARKKFGKKAGKRIPFYNAMLGLWICIGIWHGGTGYYFVASAVIPCMLLLLSDLFQPLNKRIVKALRINTGCQSWKWFRRIRTVLLICACWFVVCSGGLHQSHTIFSHAITKLWTYTPFVLVCEKIGLNALDVLLMTIGIVLLYAADKCAYNGSTIFNRMNEQNLWIRILIICVEILIIMVYGKAGSSSFIYFQF